MPRFVTLAPEEGGVVQCILGNATAKLCGCGFNLYDVPGAWTPIFVCCNWTTPISGFITIPVNFSCYDQIYFSSVFGNVCCTQCTSICVIPSSASYTASYEATCYCKCNQFRIQRYSECICNTSVASGNPGINGGSGTNGGSICAVLRPGPVCAAQYPGFMMDVTAIIGTASGQKRLISSNSGCINQGMCWPTDGPVPYEDLTGGFFNQIVVTGNNCCFTPKVHPSQSNVSGAFFGVWGRPKNTNLCNDGFQTE